MSIRFLEKSGFVFTLFFFLVAGCNTRDKAINDNYLLRTGGIVVTEKDYLDALEIMKASYPYEALQDDQVVRMLKTRLLKQLTEEIILTRRAEALDLCVSETEIEQAVKAVRDDYPDGVFEKTLLERAISIDAWKKRVKMRLLTEKVIDKELVVQVSLTPEEVREAYKSLYADTSAEAGIPDKIDAAFVKQLRREKAQKKYPQWIDALQQQYDIELNEQRWKIIFD